ncbi:hypothetical protein G6F37_002348 [Rhizopus arrhizus]|nr:hypothetical protein G6F38_006308 [Rhizopus arrhizus]KAG1162229.1 hypothetical protein G6F37_002348 [Rhizopus arrhizus]
MQQKTQTFFKQNEPMKHKCLQGPIHIIPSWDPVDRNEKPPYSYATIIAHAILSSKERRLTLNEIYNWIMENYPFYCTTSLGWQNSVRHNLSLHKSFIKIQRDASNPNHPRKGCYWTIQPGKEQGFIDSLELPVAKRIGRRRSSQASLCSSVVPYPSSSMDSVYGSSSSSSSSSKSSVYTTHSSPSPSLCDQEYYYHTSSPIQSNYFPYYRPTFVDSLFLEPLLSTNTLYPTTLYDHSSIFN